MNGSKMTPTSDMAQLAEDMSTFFEDEKIKVQNRMRTCEIFVNDVRLQSNSVRDGLMMLLQHAEDDYSTLLHLERVLNMRECGDHRVDNAAGAALGNNRAQNRRRQLPEGGPFSMDLSDKSSGGEDVLDDLFNAGGASGLPAASAMRRPLHEPIDDQLYEEENEGNNIEDTHSNGVSAVTGGLQIGSGQQVGRQNQDVAQSLPVSIPLPDPIKAKSTALDFASDLEDFEEDGDENSGVQVKKKTSDIPKKIAEIARSLYDTSDTLPCSPKNFNRQF